MNHSEHVLTCVVEESAEVNQEAMEMLLAFMARRSAGIGQATTKTLRFAIDGTCPDGTGNTTAIARELNDLQAVVEMLQEIGVPLPGLGDRVVIEAKKAKVMKMMGLARERGTLQ